MAFVLVISDEGYTFVLDVDRWAKDVPEFDSEEQAREWMRDNPNSFDADDSQITVKNTDDLA